MTTLRNLTLLTFLIAVSPLLHAQENAPVKHRILVAEYGNTGNRLLEVSASGELIWEHKPPSLCVMFEPLPNGNVVYAYGGKPTGVQEVNRQHEVVWDWVSKSEQVIGMSRLANGHILVGEQGPPQAVEVNAEREIVRTTPLSTSAKAAHQQVRRLHLLPNGHILAAHEEEGAAREVDAAGKVVWEYKNVGKTFDALRLENGNTLISCGDQKRVIEVTPAGEIAWEFSGKDAPELNLTWITSLQRLKNGNLVVCNFLRGQEGKGAHAFEVTREKKVIWTFADHRLVKSATSVRVLDEP